MKRTPEHETNLFCWRRGFKAADLGNHPYADDLVLLTRIKDEFWNHITDANKKSWFCFWDWVYTQKKPLRDKHLNKLKHITINGSNTRHFKHLKQRQSLEKVKAFRQNPTT